MWAIQSGAAAIRRDNNNAITYLLNDQFVTAASAPLTSPRTCEPGPDTVTLKDTATTHASISSAAMQFDGGASSWGDPGGYGTARSRLAGRTLFATYTRLTSTATFGVTIGWINNTRNDPDSGDYSEGIAGFRNGSFMGVRVGTSYLSQFSFASATVYQVAIVLRSTGYLLLIKGGVFTNWTLLWVGSTGSTASLRPAYANYNAAGTLDNLIVTDLGGAFASDNGLALTFTTSPANPQTATGAADGTIEATWTVALVETFELSFRRTDDSNRWIVRCDQALGNVKLFEKNAGVETQRGSTVSVTFTAASVYRIVAFVNGASVQTYIQPLSGNGTTGPTYASASFNNTITGIASSGGATTANLAAWPLNATVPSV